MIRFARLCLLAVVLAVAGMSGAHAQGYQGGDEAWRFGTTGGFTKNIQSGGGGFGGNFGFNKTFDFLGCSFSLNQFIQANFNLPSSFEEIKTALQTKLVKYAITNFSILPQLQAAIQDFQAKLGIDLRFARESCNLSTIGQEQKKVQSQYCADRHGSNSNNNDFIQCMEGKGSVGASGLRNAQNQINQMANSLCRSVTETARGLFCGGQGECGLMSLLPQMKLTCNGKGHIIGGETQGSIVGVGTIGQSFQQFNAITQEKNYSKVEELKNQGLNDDMLSNICNTAQALAAKDTQASTTPTNSQPNGTQAASRELHFLNFEGTLFADEGNGAMNSTPEESAQSASKTSSSSKESAKAENPLTEENVKRAMGCSVDDPMAPGNFIVKAAAEYGISLSPPTLSEAEKKAITQQILANMGTAGDIGKMQKADAQGVLKAIEKIVSCDNNMRGVDIATYCKLGKQSSAKRNGYFLGKSMQGACGQAEFLLKLAEQGTEGGIAKAKSSEVIQPSAEAAAGDGSRATNAGKDKVIAYAQFSRNQLRQAARVMENICRQNKNAAAVTKAMETPANPMDGSSSY